MSVSSVAVNDSSVAGSSCSLSPYPVLLCVLFFFLAPPVSLCARTHMHATDFVIMTLRTFVYVCVCVRVFQEWKDGLASPEDLSPATLQSPSCITDSLIGCTSLPNAQVCHLDMLSK